MAVDWAMLSTRVILSARGRHALFACWAGAAKDPEDVSGAMPLRGVLA
jgi:hypothetical protein